MIHIPYSPHTLKNFIVIEGLDGAGTSTQSNMLKKGLEARGKRVQLSMEPTAGPIGVLIKQIMRGRLLFSDDDEETERQLAYLFAADRHDHLYNQTDGIIQQIQKGFITISTRYLFSSYAYNARNNTGLDLIDRLNRDFPLPQVIIHLKCPAEVSIQRLEERDVLEFYEKEQELKRVATNFEHIFAPIKDRVITVDSTKKVAENAEEIIEKVLEKLNTNWD